MSKTKRNGGYILVDFSGVNLNDENPQVIPGIFTAVDAALKTNKPIIAINAVMSVEDIATIPVSPFFMSGIHLITETEVDTIVMVFGATQVQVTRDGDTESIQIVAQTKL